MCSAESDIFYPEARYEIGAFLLDTDYKIDHIALLIRK